jgi:hypothetical protein
MDFRDLPLGCLLGFAIVGGVDVPEPVIDVGEIAVDPDVFELKAGFFGADQNQKIRDFIAPFEIDHILFPPLNDLAIELVIGRFVPFFLEGFGIGLIPRAISRW